MGCAHGTPTFVRGQTYGGQGQNTATWLQLCSIVFRFLVTELGITTTRPHF